MVRLAIVSFAFGWLLSWGGPGVATAAQGEVVTFSEACDASGLVFTNEGALLVADDQSDVLLTYPASGGKPTARIDLYPLTGTPPKARNNFSAFEGAARLGDKVYFITSHAREMKGKNRPNRRRLLAVESTQVDGVEKFEPVGLAYTSLNAAFSDSKELRPLGLTNAIMQLHRQLPRLAPDKMGINIEGLAASKQGGLLIGLRNPRPQNAAGVIELENPERVVLGYGDPVFGQPHLLALDGRGISDLVLHAEQGVYYILATHHDRDGDAKLYRWSGEPDEAPVFVRDIGPPDFAAQAIAVAPDGKRLLVLSDDGDRLTTVKAKEECRARSRVEGQCACNNLVDAGGKQFRGQWLDVPALPPARPGASPDAKPLSAKP